MTWYQKLYVIRISVHKEQTLKYHKKLKIVQIFTLARGLLTFKMIQVQSLELMKS